MQRNADSPLIDYLQLMRAPAVFTALSNILAAHLITTQGSIHWLPLILLMASSAALYTGGMVLNDWFDYRTDLQSRPERPLAAGRIRRRHALLLGIGLLLCGIALASLVGRVSLFIALGIAALVLLYDGLLKGSLIGSLNMGGCRYFNWLLGLSSLPLAPAQLIIPLPIFLYTTALTLLSREEEKARHRGVLITTALGIALAILSIPFLMPGTWPEKTAVGLLALGVVLILAREFTRTFRHYSATRVQATIKGLIFGIVLLDALMVLAFGPWWGALTLLPLLLMGRLLARVMYVT
jgi:4-hydroxybenzoate polyprenyltransferase